MNSRVGSFLVTPRSIFLLVTLIVLAGDGAVRGVQPAAAAEAATRANALRNFEDYGKTVSELQELCSSVMETNRKLAALLNRSREMNESFNLQYLTLQQRMQDESRRFSLLSTVMKTKHDTAKNSINNLR